MTNTFSIFHGRNPYFTRFVFAKDGKCKDDKSIGAYFTIVYMYQIKVYINT